MLYRRLSLNSNGRPVVLRRVVCTKVVVFAVPSGTRSTVRLGRSAIAIAPVAGSPMAPRSTPSSASPLRASALPRERRRYAAIAATRACTESSAANAARRSSAKGRAPRKSSSCASARSIPSSTPRCRPISTSGQKPSGTKSTTTRVNTTSGRRGMGRNGGWGGAGFAREAAANKQTLAPLLRCMNLLSMRLMSAAANAMKLERPPTLKSRPCNIGEVYEADCNKCWLEIKSGTPNK